MTDTSVAASFKQASEVAQSLAAANETLLFELYDNRVNPEGGAYLKRYMEGKKMILEQNWFAGCRNTNGSRKQLRT